MTGLLSHRWLSIPLRILLGGVFLASAYPKLLDPPAFAQMVSNYRVLPAAAVNAAAIILPWLELGVGLALVTGFMRRGAAAMSGLLMLMFIGALAVNLYRGTPVDCGCFSVEAVARTPAEKLASMKVDVVRDVALLLASIQVLVTRVTWRRPSWPSTPASGTLAVR